MRPSLISDARGTLPEETVSAAASGNKIPGRWWTVVALLEHNGVNVDIPEAQKST